MEITQGPKRYTKLPNFFDDDMTTSSREWRYDGKSYGDLTDDEKKVAQGAIGRRHEKNQEGWAYLVGLGGIVFLLGVHLTAIGFVILAGALALLCWAIAKKF